MKAYRSFDEAVADIESASTIDAVNAIVDDINSLFESDALEVTPKQWAMLCSLTLAKATELR